MADETTREFLDRRERELSNQLAAARSHTATIEGELREVKMAKEALGSMPGRVALEGRVTIGGLKARGTLSAHATIAGGLSADPSRYAGMTIKELAIQAIIDGFPNGATMMDIRNFIRDGYGREIPPSSLRPQMHRLKADGILGQDPSTDTWNFQDGKRRQYVLYNHPRSRAAMPELKDEPAELNNAEDLRPFLDQQPDRDGNGEPDKG